MSIPRFDAFVRSRALRTTPVPLYAASMNDHRIQALWIRPAEAAPLAAQESIELVAGHGVRGDHGYGRSRHVTIVFADDYEAAAREVGVPGLDPKGRRANVVVTGRDGCRFVGWRLRLGNTLLEARGIVAPCPVMDEAHPGMMEALKPEGRGGIWCRVLEGGILRPGDDLEALDPIVEQSETSASASTPAIRTEPVD